MGVTTDWDAVTKVFNGIIEQGDSVRVTIYSETLQKTLTVVLPDRYVEDFMKRLPLFEAQAWNSKEFCTSCNGPYDDDWLQKYGGHWDTCQNRKK